LSAASPETLFRDQHQRKEAHQMRLFQYVSSQTDAVWNHNHVSRVFLYTNEYTGNGCEGIMLKYLMAYAGAGITILLLDFIWLGFIAQSFYRAEIGHLMADKPNLVIAALFYLLYAVGIIIFAVDPAIRSGNFRTALMYGALLGFFAYATYDLSNLATLKGFSVKLAIVDMAWGTVLSAVAAAAGKLAADLAP
jgi:uncharacterized membrane protein